MGKKKNILLTGATGRLGTQIVKSRFLKNLLSPPRKILDITSRASIKRFFDKNKIDAVIHCAALARIRSCHEKPILAMKTNLQGTSYVVEAVMAQEKKEKKSIRFVHISTDGVYASQEGNYSEEGPTIPYSVYGWTKLGAECAVHLLSNFCIIRTRFFDSQNLRFSKIPVDSFTSSLSVSALVEAIAFLFESGFVGTINVGTPRHSDYKCFKKGGTNIKPCWLKDIQKELPFTIWRDASLDLCLWRKITKG